MKSQRSKNRDIQQGFSLRRTRLRRNLVSEQQGFSLIEILVVLVVFGVLTVVVTQSVFLTIRGTQKSENTIKVRENIDHAIAVMERQIRNAEKIVECKPHRIDFTDLEETPKFFEHKSVDDRGVITTNIGYLTSDEVDVEDFNIDCGVSSVYKITIKASSAGGSVESGNIEVETQITRREYQ